METDRTISAPDGYASWAELFGSPVEEKWAVLVRLTDRESFTRLYNEIKADVAAEVDGLVFDQSVIDADSPPADPGAAELREQAAGLLPSICARPGALALIEGLVDAHALAAVDFAPHVRALLGSGNFEALVWLFQRFGTTDSFAPEATCDVIYAACCGGRLDAAQALYAAAAPRDQEMFWMWLGPLAAQHCSALRLDPVAGWLASMRPHPAVSHQALCACARGDDAGVGRMLANGSLLDAPHLIERMLEIACAYGHLALVETLWPAKTSADRQPPADALWSVMRVISDQRRRRWRHSPINTPHGFPSDSVYDEKHYMRVASTYGRPLIVAWITNACVTTRLATSESSNLATDEPSTGALSWLSRLFTVSSLADAFPAPAPANDAPTSA